MSGPYAFADDTSAYRIEYVLWLLLTADGVKMPRTLLMGCGLRLLEPGVSTGALSAVKVSTICSKNLVAFSLTPGTLWSAAKLQMLFLRLLAVCQTPVTSLAPCEL